MRKSRPREHDVQDHCFGAITSQAMTENLDLEASDHELISKLACYMECLIFYHQLHKKAEILSQIC